MDEDADVNYFLTGDLSDVGLSLDMFDAETRTISGKPTKKGEIELQYLASDGTNQASLTYSVVIEDEPAPEYIVEDVSSSHTLLRENAGHATTITLTVTLEEAAAADTKVTLDFAAPREGDPATRDDEFTAAWDAEYGRVVSIAEGKSTGRRRFL